MIEKLKRFVSEFSIVKDQDLPILHEFLEWAKNRVDYERSSEFIEAEKIRIHNEVVSYFLSKKDLIQSVGRLESDNLTYFILLKKNTMRNQPTQDMKLDSGFTIISHTQKMD